MIPKSLLEKHISPTLQTFFHFYITLTIILTDFLVYSIYKPYNIYIIQYTLYKIWINPDRTKVAILVIECRLFEYKIVLTWNFFYNKNFSAMYSSFSRNGGVVYYPLVLQAESRHKKKFQNEAWLQCRTI